MNLSRKKFIHKDDLPSARVLAVAEYYKVDVEKGESCQCNDSPCLDLPEGPICGSNTIIRYIAKIRSEHHAYGTTLYESTRVDYWLDQICKIDELNKRHHEGDKTAKEEFCKIWTTIELHLKKHQYLAGDRITVADVALTVSITYYKTHCPTFAEKFEGFINLKRWHAAMESITSKLSLKGITIFIKKAAPKAETAATETAATETPVAAVSLDPWKRHYSNSPDLVNDAMPWFWNNVDYQNGSFWYMHYQRLPSECNMSFLTSNLLEGFLQCFPSEFRRMSFGVINIVESWEHKGFEIVGVWYLSSSELAPGITAHRSFDVYSFEKLDPTKDQKRIEEYFCNKESVDGHKISERKVWK